MTSPPLSLDNARGPRTRVSFFATELANADVGGNVPWRSGVDLRSAFHDFAERWNIPVYNESNALNAYCTEYRRSKRTMERDVSTRFHRDHAPRLSFITTSMMACNACGPVEIWSRMVNNLHPSTPEDVVAHVSSVGHIALAEGRLSRKESAA